MAKYLIVNADDFGLARGVNEGIIKAHKEGLVTSTSLMVDSLYTSEAVKSAKSCPNLSLGLHFTASNEHAQNLYDIKNIELTKKELTRQYNLFFNLVGKKPTHIDSHQHFHTNENLLPIFVAFSKEHNIPLRHSSHIIYTGEFHGKWYGWDEKKQILLGYPLHDLISTQNLRRILGDLSEGIAELGCHPGYFAKELEGTYNKEREIELATLTDPSLKLLIKELNIRLINFAEIPK